MPVSPKQPSANPQVSLLPSTDAKRHCRALMKKLDKFGRINLSSEALQDSRLSTAPLFGDARGQMFGILLCKVEKSGRDFKAGQSSPPPEPVILKAFSGQFNGLWEAPGWAPPLLDAGVFRNAVLHADPPIKKLTAEINNLSRDNPQGGSQLLTGLIEKRRLLSQRHMNEIHRMYRIHSFSGEETDLFSLFADRSGIPAGTGDCCAPKLLNLAIQLGLQPISLAEFYWGRENRSGTKQHGYFYPPCSDKCGPVLPFMLQGTEFTGAEID
ncbi:MAG: hypothetical protein PQJ61_02710 [Spirochaetales bacterium]|uniref:Uncharacterized protein n=1 Tax=Candidatus Thalassospirochaeta sargassi TaxID=3119039 RepID=A0AAJ1IAE5_9SPIO|nr:hypothetical protein [Spirochaetales bacterium]